MGKKVKKKKAELNMNNDLEKLIKKFVILTVIVVGVVIGGYFLSQNIIDKRNNNLNEEITTGEISYDIATVGTLLNRPYKEYFVMVYNSEETDAVYYSSLITKYQSKKDSNKIYFCDLSNELNKKYYSENNNLDVSDINEIRFGKITLLKIKKGKIDKFYDSVESIKAALQ